MLTFFLACKQLVGVNLVVNLSAVSTRRGWGGVALFCHEGVEGGGVFDVVWADGKPAEGGEVGAGAEELAEVFGEGADVGAGGAVDEDTSLGDGLGGGFGGGWRRIVGRGGGEEVDGVDFDLAGGDGEFLPCSSEVVGAAAAYFDGGKGGRGLGDFAGEVGKSGADFSLGGEFGVWEWRNLALGVAGGGGEAEAESGFVGFVEFEEFVGALGCAAGEEDE